MLRACLPGVHLPEKRPSKLGDPSTLQVAVRCGCGCWATCWFGWVGHGRASINVPAYNPARGGAANRCGTDGLQPQPRLEGLGAVWSRLVKEDYLL